MRDIATGGAASSIQRPTTVSPCGFSSVHITAEPTVNCDGSTSGSTSQLILSSPAKLNLFLEVCGKRPDGFHELETVMVRTQFCDQLAFQMTNTSELTVALSDATPADMRGIVPIDERNLILKAARVLQNLSGTKLGAHIILHKRIPPESGLGGGSSNAATTLIGCRQLWKLNISDAQLHSLAASLGSDLNFLLSGAQAAVCRGRGELVEPIPLSRRLFFVALRPNAGNSTTVVFSRNQIPNEPRSSLPLANFLTSGDGRLEPLIFNRLTAAAVSINPAMAALLNRIPFLVRRPAFMSGSGSTVFVVASSRTDAKSVADRIETACCRPAWILECAPAG